VVKTKFEDVPKTWMMLFQGGNTGKLVTEIQG
jgi:NADPH-dependent curcumin reductase CurA